MRNLTLILALIILSCNNEETFKQDDRLISWKSDFVIEDGEQVEGYYNDYENFIKPYFVAKYKTDTLTVTTIIKINCCGNTVADIRTSNDTLYLLTKNISDIACSCLDFNKFTYVIHNPDNKKFVIQSKK